MEPPKKLSQKIFEVCFLLFLSVMLIRLAVRLLTEIWPVLLLIAMLAAAAIIGRRVYKHFSVKW